MVFNRCDGSVHGRTATLQVVGSNDGTNWSPIYSHDGRPFLGHKDSQPLRIEASGHQARYIRLALRTQQYFHLDEVQVFNPDGSKNLALGMPADQSSASNWSTSQGPSGPLQRQIDIDKQRSYPVLEVVKSGRELAESLARQGVDSTDFQYQLSSIETAVATTTSTESKRSLYLKAKHLTRELSLKNPLLDFDDLLFVKRVAGILYSHV